MESAELQRMFEDFNDRFFSGKLRRFRVVMHKIRVGALRGNVDAARRTVHLHPMPDDDVPRSLLHEMCHVAAGSWHGKLFRREMNRLRRSNERWVAEWAKVELEAYRNSPTWNQEMTSIRNNLLECAELSRRPSITKLERHFAGDLGMSVREFRRQVPWLRQTWKKAVLEANHWRKRRKMMMKRKAQPEPMKGPDKPSEMTLATSRAGENPGLTAPHLDPAARMVVAGSSEDWEQRVRRRGGRMSARDFRSGSAVQRSLSATRAERALQKLVDAGRGWWIRKPKQSAGKQPSWIFELVPRAKMSRTLGPQKNHS